MKTSEQVLRSLWSEEADISTRTLQRWAATHGVKKHGKEYAWTAADERKIRLDFGGGK
jgi:hypothetical protein